MLCSAVCSSQIRGSEYVEVDRFFPGPLQILPMTRARAKGARNVTRLGMRDQVEHTYMSTFSLATVYVTLSGHANTSYLNVQRNTYFFTIYLWFHTMTHLQYTLYCTISLLL